MLCGLDPASLGYAGCIGGVKLPAQLGDLSAEAGHIVDEALRVGFGEVAQREGFASRVELPVGLEGQACVHGDELLT